LGRMCVTHDELRRTGRKGERVHFLSYAEEDAEAGRYVAGWLTAHGHAVWTRHDRQDSGGRYIDDTERAIGKADAFVALLSPDFLASPWCRREGELAIRREADVRASDPRASFVHVMRIRDTGQVGRGFMRAYDQLEVTDLGDGLDGALGAFERQLDHGGRAEQRAAPGIEHGQPSQFFRDRQEELERVIRGLANAVGPHFWLVLAPPRLGKTWFLGQLTAELTSLEPGCWTARLLDVADQPANVRSNAWHLLAQIFATPEPLNEPDALRSIVKKIIETGRSFLCLIDSAELLPGHTASTLRTCLGQILRGVQDAGVNLRLAAVVASRQDDDWRGVTPPRMHPLPLTAFTAESVEHALGDLAERMGRSFAPGAIRQDALVVHQLTEGLPALLMECLQWIRKEQWVDLDRLREQELFEELAQPYIEHDLLAPESLLPLSRGIPPTRDPSAERARNVLERSFRALAPYRFFTQSHLRYLIEADPGLNSALEDLHWSMADLWRAISATALLARPLDEPWQELYPAIRRLLYRYFYRSIEDRVAVHRDAGKFVEVWADRQSGKEQVIGLVECLWHEAMALNLTTGPKEVEAVLSESAVKLCDGLRPSSAYTTDELRSYAASRMKDDEEFQDAVRRVKGLFPRLVAIVAP
jgi:TIR domain